MSLPRKFLLSLGSALTLGTMCIANAQPARAATPDGFPSRTIKFIVPFGPGSSTDTSARYYSRKLQELTGQPVVVENKGGANGFIAVKQVLSAKPDGYTVFIGSNSTLAVNAALFKKLPYDPIADFSPLTIITRSPGMLIVPASAPYDTLQAFLDEAKANPGKINFGAGSAGYQLMAELLNEKAGIQTVHVPFKSAGETTAAIAAGTVEFAFGEVTSVQELAKGGKVKVLAAAAEKRVSTMPDVPTANEAGLPGFQAYTWVAGMVNSQTPPDITKKLADLFVQIAQMDETREFFERLGASTVTDGPDALRKFQADEIALWKRIAEQAKVPLQ